jgi:hypothetical protein
MPQNLPNQLPVFVENPTQGNGHSAKPCDHGVEQRRHHRKGVRPCAGFTSFPSLASLVWIEFCKRKIYVYRDASVFQAS